MRQNRHAVAWIEAAGPRQANQSCRSPVLSRKVGTCPESPREAKSNKAFNASYGGPVQKYGDYRATI
jgi:hypothetical protein